MFLFLIVTDSYLTHFPLIFGIKCGKIYILQNHKIT